jgi:DNA-binding transcriptional LysR family regulator
MERLDLRLVEYFVAVAEELHFSRAAARLRIAQPSLSQQIRRLEDQLGVTLLERTSRHVALTPAGETLLLEGKRTLAQAARAIETTRATAAERVVVGFYGSAGSALLADVLREFSKRHPSVTVTVRELLLGSIDDILAGKVDVAFTRLLPGQANLEIKILAHESRLVVLPVSQPHAGRKSLTFAELRHESFITNPVVHTDGAPSRWLAEQRRHGLPGRVAAQSRQHPGNPRAGGYRARCQSCAIVGREDLSTSRHLLRGGHRRRSTSRLSRLAPRTRSRNHHGVHPDSKPSRIENTFAPGSTWRVPGLVKLPHYCQSVRKAVLTTPP